LLFAIVRSFKKPLDVAVQHFGYPDLQLIARLSKAIHNSAEQRLVHVQLLGKTVLP